MIKDFLEIETKYEVEQTLRLKFKDLVRALKPADFLYIESTDIYYTKNDVEFLRYRMSAENIKDSRAELTFKKKHSTGNNIIRTEVNLRIDKNDTDTVDAFCSGLGYSRNFSIFKLCDIYKFKDVTLVFYTVKDDFGKFRNFIEIEVLENSGLTEEESWNIIKKYEDVLKDLGINAQRRKKLSLFEMYKK